MTRLQKLLCVGSAICIPCNFIYVASTESVWIAVLSGIAFALNTYAVLDLLGYSPGARAEKRAEDWRRVSDDWQRLAETWRNNYFELFALTLERSRQRAVTVVDVTDPANPKPLKVRPNQ